MTTKKEGTQITKREFAIFKAECRRWVDRFGLTDWKLYYTFEEIEGGLASVNRDWEGKCATVTLHPFQERIPKADVEASVKSSARHEMLHLLLGELDYLNGRRAISNDIWSAAEHGVIRRLERALDGSPK